MSQISVSRARSFIEAVELEPQRVTRGPLRSGRDGAESVATTLDQAKDQAAVVGSDVISFVRGVTVERREAVINSSLLAQLVARRKVGNPDAAEAWYRAYFEVLSNIGWVLQDWQLAEYHEEGQNFEAHKAILAVATTLLGPASTALALVTTTINSLHSMGEDSPWITLFNRETRSTHTARFQISLVEEGEDGQFSVSLMAFVLDAKSTLTQVLFFKARAQDATLRHYSGRVTIDTHVLDAVRDDLQAKLATRASEYVKTLPEL